jgi:hypothetical protein
MTSSITKFCVEDAWFIHHCLEYLGPSDFHTVAQEYFPEKAEERMKRVFGRYTHINGVELWEAVQLAGMVSPSMCEPEQNAGLFMTILPSLKSIDFSPLDRMPQISQHALNNMMMFASTPKGVHVLLQSARYFSLQVDPELGQSLCTKGLTQIVKLMRFLPDSSARLREEFGIRNEADLQVALAKNIIEYASPVKLRGFLEQITARIFEVRCDEARIEIFKVAARKMMQQGASAKEFSEFEKQCFKAGLSPAEIKGLLGTAPELGLI